MIYVVITIDYYAADKEIKCVKHMRKSQTDYGEGHELLSFYTFFCFAIVQMSIALRY